MFWIFGMSLFFTAHAMLGVQQNFISYLTGEHVSPAQAASLLGIALAAAAPGKLISGVLADKVSARAGMIFSVICVALGILALLNTAPRSDMMYGLAVVFGMGYGGIFNASPTIVFEYFGTHQVGKAMGLFYVFFGLGTASGGELAGHIFDETHRWSVPFTVDFSLACAALLLVLVSGRMTSRAAVTGQARSLRLLKPYDRQLDLRRQLLEVRPQHSHRSDHAHARGHAAAMAEMVQARSRNRQSGFSPNTSSPGDIIVAGPQLRLLLRPSHRRQGDQGDRRRRGARRVILAHVLSQWPRDRTCPCWKSPAIHDMVETGHRLRVDIERGFVENLTTGRSLRGNLRSGFLSGNAARGRLDPAAEIRLPILSRIEP